jgi:1-phosphofructokinase family hexose kinase
VKQPLVLALNPSVDVEWRVPQVRWEEKNDVLSERRWPGGKGVNVARWLHHFRARPRLLIPLGGATGREMAAGLKRMHIPLKVVPLREPTRANVIVTAQAGGQLRFNPLGPTLSVAEWRVILRQTQVNLQRASLLILSGSLPRGLAVDAYADLIRLADGAGVRTLLDCDGPRFVESVKARPFLVKPNWQELEQWAGRELRSLRAVRQEAKRLSKLTRGWVLVSLGERGAHLVNDSSGSEFLASSPAVNAVNTVGAGDALLAAVATRIHRGEAPAEWLAWGVASGSAATGCEAGVLPSQAEIAIVRRSVQVEQLS